MPELLTGFYYKNFVVLVMLAGMLIMTLSDVFLDRRMIGRLRGTLGMLLLLVICDYSEVWLGNQEHFSKWRMLFSALCYSLRPLIIMELLFLIHPTITKWVRLPAILNMILAFSVFFTDIVYYYSPDNHFGRGPLSYVFYFGVPIYITMLFWVSFMVVSKRSQSESWFVTFLALTSLLAVLGVWNAHDEVVIPTYAAELLLYYLYIYSQYTKRDALTNLFNRQSFYSDFRRHPESITGIISIDMNELKRLNDTYGHEAGDRGIKAIADIFLSAATEKERVYRTGGDEFIMICRGRSEEALREMIDAMRVTIGATGYSCAFGLCCAGTPDEMMKEADRLMYEDKARIKAEIAAKGGVLHNRT